MPGGPIQKRRDIPVKHMISHVMSRARTWQTQKTVRPLPSFAASISRPKGLVTGQWGEPFLVAPGAGRGELPLP